jgi:hypothetical protein
MTEMPSASSCFPLLVARRRPDVLEQRHVGAELPEQQCLVHGHRAGPEHADAPVTDLPAMAVRAVQHVGAPSRGEARDVGQLIARAGRSQDAPGGHRSVTDFDTEAVAVTAQGRHPG